MLTISSPDHKHFKFTKKVSCQNERTHTKIHKLEQLHINIKAKNRIKECLNMNYRTFKWHIKGLRREMLSLQRADCSGFAWKDIKLFHSSSTRTLYSKQISRISTIWKDTIYKGHHKCTSVMQLIIRLSGMLSLLKTKDAARQPLK